MTSLSRSTSKYSCSLSRQALTCDSLLLALLKTDIKEIAEILKAGLVDAKKLEAEIRRKRGGRRVESKSAEAGFDALNKCEHTPWSLDLR